MLTTLSSTFLPNIIVNMNKATKDKGSTMKILNPKPAGIYPNNTVTIPTNTAYHIWVLTCSIWSHPAPVEESIVVSYRTC